MANTKVTTGVIKDDAVGADQLASNAVVTASITDNAITTAKINDNAILTAKINDSAITNAKMSSNSVDSDQYVDASIDTAHIRDGQITSAKLDTNMAIGGTLTLGSHLLMGDNDRIKIGAGTDLQIFHNGSDSIVLDSGDGDLKLIGSSNVRLQNQGDNGDMVVATSGGAVTLYYSGVAKLATASGGVTVTGALTSGAITSSAAVQGASYNLGSTLIVATNRSLRSIPAIHNASDTQAIDLGNVTYTILNDPEGNNRLYLGDSGDAGNYHNNTIHYFRNTAAAQMLLIQDTTLDLKSVHTITKANGNLTLDASGDIVLDADGANVYFNDGGTERYRFKLDATPEINVTGGTFTFKNNTSDADILFSGNDGGSAITALTLDMSNAGKATFNAGVVVGVDLTVGNSYISNNYAQFANMRVNNNAYLGSESTPSAIQIQTGGAVAFGYPVTIGTATVAAANAAADDFVIKGTGTAVGLTISQDSDSGTGTIFFGDTSSSAAGGIRYNHNTGDMAISAEDNINLQAGANDAVVVNEDSVDADFRVESNDHEYKFFLDAGNNNIGIATSSPAADVHIKQIGDIGNGNSQGLMLETGAGSQKYILQCGRAGVSNAYFNLRDVTNTRDIFSVIDTDGKFQGHTPFEWNNAAVFNEGSQDYDFRVESNGNDNMLFVDGGTNRVGIGMTPTNTLSVKANGNANIIGVQMSGNTVDLVSLNQFNDHGAIFVRGNNGVIQHEITATGGVVFNQGSLDQDFRVESNGNTHMLFVDGGADIIAFGKTHNIAGGGMYFNHSNATRSHLVVSNTETSFAESLYYGNRQGSDGQVFQFRRQNANVGNISVTSSATSFNTSSDYRLKENVDYDFTALDRVAQLKPARFNFIADADTTVDGFLAHEVQEIVPEAVTGEKDGETMQGMDYGRITPLLVKAIQEQQTLIESLTARIEELEG